MKTMRHIRFMIFLLVIFSFSKASYGQVRDTCRIYFPQNSSRISADYLGNKESVAKLVNMLENPRAIDTVHIRVFSSPEGQFRKNELLTERRANALLSFVQEYSDGMISQERILVTKVSENWEGLTACIEERYFGKYRDFVLEILHNESLSDHYKKFCIKYINRGELWNFFIQEYMDELRFSDEIIVSKVADLPEIEPFSSKVESVLASSSLIPQSYQTPSPLLTSSKDKFCFGFRTNLLYDLLMVPNVGLEFHLGKRFALGLNYCHAWWSNEQENNFWRIYGGDVVLRKYFGGKQSWSALSGHHLGAYGQWYTYDFELGAAGQLSEMTYGAGLEYGYTVPLCRSISLDFTLGCGYLTGEYKVYEPEDQCYVWQETRQRNYIGPTKAEISLIWLLGNRKGGKR